MKEQLISTLGFGGILSQEEATRLASFFEFRKLKATEHFITQHKKSKELAFIRSGIMRSYVQSSDLQESTRYFYRPGQFVMDIPSFYDHLPSSTSIQAATEVELLVINSQQWLELCEEMPKLILLAKTISELTFLNKIKDSDFLRFGTSKQKYDEFVKRYPDLALAVPQQYIASYLQITPQSLSRLRKGS